MSITGKILIVDDEAILRHTFARILQHEGMDVTTAENGEQCIVLLQENDFDLVYLDLRMPGMFGLDVLDKIRQNNPGLPVILFTAQPDLNSAVEALRRGATDYLLKPLNPQAIIERTQNILRARQKERRKKEILSQMEALQAELIQLDAETAAPPPPEPLPVAPADRYLKRGSLNLDLHTRRLSYKQRVISLPPATFDYLLVLARHAPQVVDYQTLVAEAQGYRVEAREAQELVKWHIHHIRQAIEPDGERPTYLFNVRGVGYRLVTDG